MRDLFKYSICMVSITLLSACGGGGTDFTRGAFSTFNGTWAQACDGDITTNPFDSNQVVSQSSEAILTIAGISATLDVTEYLESENCSTGVNENFIVEINLLYGDEVPDAASVCSNTTEVDAVITSVTSNDVTLTGDQLTAALTSGSVPSLINGFDLICSSSDSTLLYFGANDTIDSGTSEATRPTIIDDSFFLTRQ